jgi:hypothetical protein
MTQEQHNYNWIITIIDSCNNDFHFEAVDNLIYLFGERHKNYHLHLALLDLRQRHWNHLHNILT